MTGCHWRLQVVKLEAEDRDTGDNGRVLYSIVSQVPADTFRIDQDGVVYTTQTLDRETIDEYKVVISARVFPARLVL